MKEVTLKSGKILKITVAPFEQSRALFETILEEAKTVHIDGRDEVANLMKDLYCVAFSSKKIKLALVPCLERCVYDGKKIGKDTFEDSSAREDYDDILTEVTKDNIAPFTKGLFAQFAPLLEKVRSFLQ
jgi:hypothetical protein